MLYLYIDNVNGPPNLMELGSDLTIASKTFREHSARTDVVEVKLLGTVEPISGDIVTEVSRTLTEDELKISSLEGVDDLSNKESV